MAETRMIPGVGLVRRNDDGSFEVLAPSGASASADVSRIVAPNPVRAAKEAQEAARREAADARANAASERAADAASRAATNDGVANQIKALEIKLKERELAGEDPKAVKEERTRLTTLRSLANQINRVQSLFEKGPGATKGIGALADYLPSDANAAFDTAGASLSAQGLAAFRVPGTGTVSDRDAMMFDRANLPEASNRDVATEEQLRGIKARVEEEFRSLGQPLPRWDPAAADVFAAKPEQRADNEVPDPMTGADLKPPAPGLMDPNAGTETTVASGPTRSTYDPRVSAQIDAMINAGASKGMIDAVLTRQKFAPLQPDQFNAAKAWMKANPGKRYYGANASRVQDMSLLQRAAGSDAGAFLAQMGNAATAGIPAALAGPSGQGALDAMAANSPNASIVGSTIGNVTGAAGAELGVAARAPAALARFAPRIADALFGGLQGFNGAREGEGSTGALVGAGAGAAGGFLGERVLRGVAAVTGGVRNPAVRYLRDRGIPLTVGQTVEDSGAVGRTIKGVEDALTSVPGVGNMIDARRTEGLEAFNRVVFQDAGAPGSAITATGAEGLGQVRQSVQDAYGRALEPASLDVNDPQFMADVAAAQAAAQGIPNVQPTMPSDYAQAALTDRLAATNPAGQMSGREFQEAYRGLGRDGRARAASDFGHEIAGATRQGQDALGEALERQNPGAFDGFLEANAANRRMNVLAAALKPAGNQADELITPAQLNRADITSTSRLEGQINSAAGNRPFYDLATAGQQVLPSRLPDSGTAKRAIVGALTTGTLGGTGLALGGADGAGYGTGGGVALSAALALGGTRAGQRALTTMLTERPDAAVQLGNILMQQVRLGGMAGAGAGTALATAR